MVFEHDTQRGKPRPTPARAEAGAPGVTRRSFITHAAAVAGAAALAGLDMRPAAAAPRREVETSFSPEVIPNVRVAITDSYGTVFRILDSVTSALRGIVPKPKDFAKMWLNQQLLRTETLAAMGPHAYFDWWELVHRTGRWVLEERNVQVTDEQWKQMLQAWWTPPPFKDAEAFYSVLNKAGVPTAILSNGSPEMLHAAAKAVGWLPELEAIISVDQAYAYKSSPQAYLLAHDVFKVPAVGDLLFISGHQWDIAGAAAAGLRTVYVDRDNQPQWHIGYDADYVFNDMKKLAEAIVRGQDVTGSG